MSYILDALKKANAEREHGRGAAPGLYTQPVRATSAQATQTDVEEKKRNALLLTLIAALTLCIATIATLFWNPLTSPAPAPALSPSSRLVPLPVTSLQPPPAQQSTIAPLPNTAPTSAVTVRVTPVPYNPPLPKSTPPQPEPTQSPAAKPHPSIRQKKPSAPAAETTPTPPTTQPTPSPLPASARATLPPLVVSGSTYSDNPAYRMLIINGQVYREGEFPAADIKLQQIKPKSAVLNYKGNIYTLTY